MEENYFKWANENSRKFLEEGYLKELGINTEQRVEQIALTAGHISGSFELAERVKEVVSKGWCSLSSPIWANYGLDRGLPISCFGSYMGIQ